MIDDVEPLLSHSQGKLLRVSDPNKKTGMQDRSSREGSVSFMSVEDDYNSLNLQPPRSLIAPEKLVWKEVAWLLLSDIVGTSVLTFGGVARKLGWIPTIVAILCFFPISVFISVLMARTRHMLCEAALIHSDPPPQVNSMNAVAKSTLGDRWALFVVLTVYGSTLLGNASYLLAMGEAFQVAWFNQAWCMPTATVIACVALLPFLIGVRKLTESVWLCFFNMLLIFAVIVISLSSIIKQGRKVCVETYYVAPDLTFMIGLGAFTNIIYAYAGQWMYFEIMEEMETPTDFARAFTIAGPLMVVTYLSVATVSYYYMGQFSMPEILQNVARDDYLRVAASFLFLHVLIVYLIKSVVLARFFHSLFCPGTVEKRTCSSFVHHTLCGLAMLGFCYLIANLIPFFDLLLGFIGGLLAGPINFLMPILYYLIATGKLRAAHAIGGQYIRTAGFREQQSVWKDMCVGFREQRTLEMVFLVIIAIIIVLTMVVGTADVIGNIFSSSASNGAPFDCHPLQKPPNTTHC